MPGRPKVGEKADQELVVLLEYTTVATIIRKTREYGRVQYKTKIQAAFAHKQALMQNVKRAREEMLVHVWGKVKRAFFVRAHFKTIEFIFELSVSFLQDYVFWQPGPYF